MVALAGLDRLRRVLCRQRLVRLPLTAQSPDRPRDPGRRAWPPRAVAAIARDLFSGAALARAMALIMIAMGPPRLLAFARRRARSLFRLAFRILPSSPLCGARRVAYGRCRRTHHATRTPLDPLAIPKLSA